MITSQFLNGIYTEARPIIERHLDDAELLAGMREVVAAQGGDWASLKALITAEVKDWRDDAGTGKHVRKILDKADYSAAYADMLGLAKMNEGNNFSEPQDDFKRFVAAVIATAPRVADVRAKLAETACDPETGEIIEPQAKASDEVMGSERE